MTSLRKRFRQVSKGPFARLVNLFLFRVLHGSGEDSDDLDFSFGLILALLALPGGFCSIILFEKYATFLQWARGVKEFDPLAAALPDEYFFIVLSMTVTGAVAVWKWDSIFPDRRDYMNLVPLPLSMWKIFWANLVAMLLLAVILAVDVNAASAVLFPTVVSASQQTFRFFADFAAVHAITVALASIFAFFAMFAMLGISMAILPPVAFRKSSRYLRGMALVGLFAMLATTADVPARIARLDKSPHSFVRFLPSAWFLGLCQWLRARADPALTSLAHRAVAGIAAVIAVAILSYAVGYRRHFLRIPELSESGNAQVTSKFGWLGRLIDRAVLRTPFQRGGVRFAWKTLLRSERHALILAGFTGWGLVLASQAMLRAREFIPAANEFGISSDALSVPLILAFCVIIGVRLTFEIPVELRANWIFRFLLDADQHECKPTARKIIALLVVPSIIFLVVPIYAYLGFWKTGVMHGLLVLIWSCVLAELLLFRFRKIPFTCALPVFRQHAPVAVILGIFGFFFFAILTADFEHWALARPVRMLIFVPWPAAILLWLHYLQIDSPGRDHKLVFEDDPPSVFDGLLRLEE
jgi:hypothetical protein